jgi:hypothetical protein
LFFSSTRGYGWNTTIQSRERTTNPDITLNTFVFTTPVMTWNYLIPNGNYLVTIASGDPDWAQGPHRVVIEGKPAITDLSTIKGQFIKVSDVPVTVSDGSLTIEIGGTAGSTLLNYVTIKPVVIIDIPSAPTGFEVK